MSADAVRFFQALGDETRLRLVTELRRGERTVGELVDALGCPQPKVSRHLRVLKEAGLVSDRRDGRNVCYALATPRAWSAEVRRWVESLEGGFAAEELLRGRSSPSRPRRRRAEPSPATSAVPSAKASSATPSAKPNPAPEKESPPARPRPRRSDLDEHLL